jgi:hypothetical protein
MKSENVGLITFTESEIDQIEGIGEKEAKEVLPIPSKLTQFFKH